MLKVELKNKDESVLTIDMSDEFVVWFKKKHNLKRWAPRQFTEWLGIVLQDEMKFKHHNHYAWVYYFNSRHHKDNPCWVFLGSLNDIERKS